MALMSTSVLASANTSALGFMLSTNGQTSAAAPTAAAIAALVLQNKGGPGSVTPAQMKTMLQRSAFPHDLDPYSSKATAIATNIAAQRNWAAAEPLNCTRLKGLVTSFPARVSVTMSSIPAAALAQSQQ